MKRIVLALCATSALALAAPAYAQTVTATNVTNGNKLDTPIDASLSNTTDNATQVYGSTAGDRLTQDVTFTGGIAKQAVGSTGNAKLDISNGGGFANIKDSTADTATLWSIIIDPTDQFTDMKLAVMLTGPGTLDIWYLLTSGGGYQLCTTCSYAASDANTNYLINVTGGVFDAMQVVARASGGLADGNSPLKQLDQVSYNKYTPTPPPPPPAVPEPTTWAMMLLGFVAMGMTIRRRTVKALRQLA